ncbi:hypothetical protein ACA910_007802 [Epithemia clementina (nom. ined.)]
MKLSFAFYSSNTKSGSRKSKKLSENDLEFRRTEIGDDDDDDDGVLVYGSAIKGRRLFMEDELIAVRHPLDEGNSAVLAAVFDGHGGSSVSRFLKDNIYDTLLQKMASSSNLRTKRSVDNFVEILTACLHQLDETVLDRKEWHTTGSTALVAWYVPIKKETQTQSNNTNAVGDFEIDASTLILANIGDSRAVLGRVVSTVRRENTASEQQEISKIITAIALTRDHKPDDPQERHRIENEHGGRVSFSRFDVPRVNGILALSRAIGDASDRPFVSGEPEIRVHTVGDDARRGVGEHETVMDVEQEFVILATDGLWDVMTPKDAVEFVIERINDGTPKREIPFQIVQEAFKRDSSDNITAVIMWLRSVKN